MTTFRNVFFASICLSLFGCDKSENFTGRSISHDTEQKRHVATKLREGSANLAGVNLASSKKPSENKNIDGLLSNCKKVSQVDGSGSISVMDLRDAYNQLAIADANLALQQFSDPETFIKLAPAMDKVAETVAERSPEILVKWLRNGLSNYNDSNDMTKVLSLALSKLAIFEPDMALQLINEFGIGDDQKARLISAAFRGMASRDPSRAMTEAASLDPSLASAALASAAYGAKNSDPQAAISMALAITDSKMQKGALNEVYAAWFKDDPIQAKENLMRLDMKAVEDVLVSGAREPISLMSDLSKSDPLFLLSLLDGFYPTSVNRELFEVSIRSAVTSQPSQTFSTISKLPESEMKLGLYGKAYATLSREDPAKAIEMFSLEKEPNIRSAALPGIAISIGCKGMDETVRFLDRLNDGEKSIAFSEAFGSIVNSDLESAAKYLADAGTQTIELSSEKRQAGYKEVAYRIAETNLNEAKDWMSQLTQEDQPFAMSGIAFGMAQRDAKSLGNYLNSIEKNEVWAAGVRVLISTVESGDVEMANKWKKVLSDAKL